MCATLVLYCGKTKKLSGASCRTKRSFDHGMMTSINSQEAMLIRPLIEVHHLSRLSTLRTLRRSRGIQPTDINADADAVMQTSGSMKAHPQSCNICRLSIVSLLEPTNADIVHYRIRAVVLRTNSRYVAFCSTHVAPPELH